MCGSLLLPTRGDLDRNPGICFDWESNQKPFGLQTSIQSTEPHQPGVVQTFLVKHQIMQVTQPYYNPDWAPCDFWLFPKLKSPWKGRDFRPSMRFRKIQQGSWWWLGKLCEVPRCLLWRGLRCHCPMYNVSCVFYFAYCMAGYLLDRPHIFWFSSLSILAQWFMLSSGFNYYPR